MARRQVEEINAGSMADIAFLLLIFFLVTTTMEVDAGIGRQLPVKNDIPLVDQPPVNKRNVLEIMANKLDNLQVEGKPLPMDQLYDVVMDFYTVNKNGERDANMPLYENITTQMCQTEIAKLELALAADPLNVAVKSDLSKWKDKLELCKLTGGSYREIHKSAVIQVRNQSGTSYGLYMEVNNILKLVVNELRVKACEELNFPDYYTLKESDDGDVERYFKYLRILVPERILESKIEI